MIEATLLVLALAVALVLACHKPAGTDAADWSATWQHLQTELPSGAAVSTAADPRKLCERALGVLRETEPALRNGPNEAAIDAFARWQKFSMKLYYECPVQGGEHAGWDAGLAEATSLREQVEQALAEPPSP